MPDYLIEKVLIKSLESRVTLRFYSKFEMKNNVKKGKDVLSQLLLYSIFLSVYIYFRTKMVSLEAFVQYPQMVESFIPTGLGLEYRNTFFFFFLFEGFLGVDGELIIKSVIYLA